MPKNSTTVSAKAQKRISGMAKAMKGWETSTATSTKAPSGKFGRTVFVEVADLKIDGSQLDIEFEVPFDDDTEANEASITIYNLSKSSAAHIKHNSEVSITAGYQKDTGVIFAGRVSSASTKWVGADRVTTIKAIDCEDLLERDVDSIAYSKNVKASYILKDLLSRLKLPVAVFKIRRDHTYKDGVTVSSGLMDAISKYAAVCGVSAYICKGKVYVRHLTDGDNTGFSVNVETGLLDSPEEFTETEETDGYTDVVQGMRCKMLLEHRITTASIINIESRNFSGKYRVRSGTHVGNASSFYTEIECIEG